MRRRPLLATGLRLANFEAPMKNMLRPYPFGLVGAGFAYQDAIHHLFIDNTEHGHIDDLYKIDLPKADQPALMVNMLAIH